MKVGSAVKIAFVVDGFIEETSYFTELKGFNVGKKIGTSSQMSFQNVKKAALF